MINFILYIMISHKMLELFNLLILDLYQFQLLAQIHLILNRKNHIKKFFHYHGCTLIHFHGFLSEILINQFDLLAFLF